MNYFYEREADRRDYYFFRQKNKPSTSSHFHSAQELILVKKGTMYATIGNTHYEIEAGQGCFVPRFRPHSYSYQDENTEVYTFVGDYSCFENAIQTLGGVPPTKFYFSDFSLIDPMAEYYSKISLNTNKKVFFTGLVNVLLARIAESNTLVPIKKDESEDKICAALEFIDRNSEKELSLPLLAEKFGYSPQHFSRLFHAYVQTGLNEYVNSVRISRAKRRLEAGMNATDAAFLSGFSSIETFYRVYKKAYGTSPNIKK